MSHIIEEVTKLFPVEVDTIFEPHSIEEIQEFLKKFPGKISVGGGRYSMGGQTAIVGNAQIDMRKMNQIIHFLPEEKLITVQTGITWRDIQDTIDPHDLSIMTMQTYSNFTVGGSLSVNVHGRYIGFGPLILSVKSIRIILANGDIVMASRTENSDIFYGAIGGYGGIGIIVEATLELRENVMLEREYMDMDSEQYGEFFQKNIRDNKDVIFHNGDIYPPHYSKIRATSWKKTSKLATTKDRLIPRNTSYSLNQKVYNFMTNARNPFTNTDYGKWTREHIIDPLVYRKPEIHSRNYEASYDVAELEPRSRKDNSYVLEEYFCPVTKINEFIPKMREIFNRHEANIINVSIRHALPDDGSLLAWAQEEVFAFVVYYNQKTSIPARREVAVWTRELINAAISVGGRYYLPYQLHGTHSQLQKCYSRFDEYCALKKKYDPTGRFSNSLLEKYYFEKSVSQKVLVSRFQTVYDTPEWRDRFYIFLQNIFHIAPTAEIHSAIWDISQQYSTDKEIYTEIQKKLPYIKPMLADMRYGI
ncbi:FAD-binding protein, partial [Candidatus Gracilibacteria bacterium]|nr:FAD-binding protein [Candidatus Gracilibacteria bacterium]